MYLTTEPSGGGRQGVANGQQIGNGQAYGGATGYAGGGGRMGGGNNACFNCGKLGHMAHDCWWRQGRNVGGSQVDPELEEIKEQFRMARKEKLEQEEKRKKEEEKRIREEEETKRNLEFAWKAEEFKQQLRTELFEEWRRNQADAVKATEKSEKSAKKTRKKKKRHLTEHGGPKRRRARRKRRTSDSSEDSESSCSTDDENTSEDTSSGSETSGKITRNKERVKRGTANKRTKAKMKNSKDKGKIEEMRTPIRTYEKGESFRVRKQPQVMEEEMRGGKSLDEEEPKTPLTGGFKGLAAGCSQKGLIEYCISGHKIFSAKKADALRKICEQGGIKYTKKPEIVEILARHQVQLAYDGFDDAQANEKDTMKTKASGTPRKEFVKDRISVERPAKRQEPTIIRSAPVQLREESN
ncbi:hypothetical protein CBR_g50272 [Chara braunii]|uniref:CCHC-type domain-containing protein n=1 Tax=Chara braunii TaxID=69332 RepID=A0A388M6F9_CHABU|nr:hypothetical protein CBR_g50272 [Chara braunii]|eukprot:GBG90178.1 hypothetical protein CBR_g50272 [Chara braunii]